MTLYSTRIGQKILDGQHKIKDKRGDPLHGRYAFYSWPALFAVSLSAHRPGNLPPNPLLLTCSWLARQHIPPF